MRKYFILGISTFLVILSTVAQEGIIKTDSINSVEIFENEKITDTSTSNLTIRYDENGSLNVPNFDKNIVEKYKDDNAFDYSENLEEANWWTQFKRWLGNIWNSFWDWILGDYKANGFFAFLIEAIPYLIIAGIIAFIIWLFFKLNPGARLLKSKEKPSVFFTEEEEIIKSKNIKKLIDKALKAKNYRLAVRYYYLLILRNLKEAELIEYEFDKTNTDYFSEIKSEPINKNFQKATNLYDYIWYGNFDVTESDYLKAQNTFSNLENLIPKANV